MNKNNTNAVPLNTTTFNTRLLNTTRLNTNGFPVLSKRSGSSADISQAIMDSLVCWYDPGKQQCTNESMAANPVLADLSGNGHDITCYNFAWAGMSGIGGYVYNNSNVYSDSNVLEENATFNIVNWVDGDLAIQADIVTGVKGQILNIHIPAFDIKISGIPEGYYLGYNDGRNNGNTSDWGSNTNSGNYYNGTYHFEAQDITIEPYDAESTCKYTGFRWTLKGGSVDGEEVDVKIEVLPLYPNALVSDGVDDYCYTKGMPILTDYTVIAKRKWVQTENDNNDCFAAKGNNLASFLIERYGNNGSQECYSFGQYNGVSFVQEDVIYQTKESYNGYPLKVGTATDVDNLVILGRTSAPLGCIQAALYSFLLFDRTLTTAEIEWVKQNMIESGGVLKTDWSDSSLWAFRDGIHTVNDKRVEGTLSSNIMVITSCITTNNFMEVVIENTQTPAYNIKVTGLKNGITLQYKDAYTATYLYFNEDGIYTIPAHNTNGRWYGFSFNKTFENENIVIQQLLS